MLAFLITAASLAPQALEPLPPSPFDRMVELEISADDVPLIEGRGPTTAYEYEVEFTGTLHVWTRSELDLFLRVEDAAELELLAEDDDSGGGSTPWVELRVEPGDYLAVLIAVARPGEHGALELHLAAAPESEATLEASSQARARTDEARRLLGQGQLDAARTLVADFVRELQTVPGATYSESIADVLWDLGFQARELGDRGASSGSWKATAIHRERTLPADHLDLLAARSSLAVTMGEMGDLAGARALQEAVLAARERTLPADHPDLLDARSSLAVTMGEMGDVAGARALFEAVLAALERTLPADHPDLLNARGNLAGTMWQMGDLAGARALFEAVLAALERTLPADHPDLLNARGNLAGTMGEMGDLAGARALEEAVLAARERTLSADHPDVLNARSNLAGTMWQMRDLPGARALLEAVLAARERTLPADHLDLLRARSRLAGTMGDMGDLAGARALQEAVLAAGERTLPADHPDLLTARSNLAVTMRGIGDLAGARALQEAVLAARERTLPADHPDLLRARSNLAVTMGDMGDLPGARALQEAVLAARERTLPADHPDLLNARSSQALTMRDMGDLPGARALLEAVLAARERTLPADHPDLLHARSSLALTMSGMGDLLGACALQEAVLAAYERTLPADHPRLLSARLNLAGTMWEMGDLPGARALFPAQAAGMRLRVLGSLALAPRQAREAVGAEAHRLAGLLFLTQSSTLELRASVFELQETMRMVSGEAARAVRNSNDPEIEDLMQAARACRADLNELISASSTRDSEQLSSELTRLLQERDRLEREASRLLSERSVVTEAIQLASLAEALRADAALVGYARHTGVYQDETGRVLTGPDQLLAHVVLPDGSLLRIDLGEASELEALVATWRASLGAPLLRGIGALAPKGDQDPERTAGEALRARLLDPILAGLGEETRRLHVCADDFVYLVPLDALPLGDASEGGRIGDRWSVTNEVSCARLVAPAGARDAPVPGGLLALGGVDYDVGVADAEAVEAPGEASRSALPDRFPGLLQTRFEAQSVAALFEELVAVDPVVLTRKQTTKAALFEHATDKRYLHLATHGWFAPESLRSTLDVEPDEASWTRMSLEDRVTGMAPMLLCGLALAGANRPIDALGRRDGILTAEELCSLDLSTCELAVLSACETNVGIRRAGQGVQSLQAALYAAGARTSITSLWKVDDAATRFLMELFYTKLWEEELPKTQALWEAKRVLRENGAPVKDWAGWVLTGSPD